MAPQGGELPKRSATKNEYVYSVMADRRVPFIPGGKLQCVGMHTGASAFQANEPLQLGKAGRSSEFSLWYTDFIQSGAENDTAKDVSGGKWQKVGTCESLRNSLGDDGTVQRRIKTLDGTIWTVSRQIAGKASSSAPNSAYASPAFNRAAATGGGSGGRGSGGSGGSSGGGGGGGGSGAAAGPSASADEPPTVHRESSLIKSALRLLPQVVVAATLSLPAPPWRRRRRARSQRGRSKLQGQDRCRRGPGVPVLREPHLPQDGRRTDQRATRVPLRCGSAGAPRGVVRTPPQPPALGRERWHLLLERSGGRRQSEGAQ